MLLGCLAGMDRNLHRDGSDCRQHFYQAGNGKLAQPWGETSRSGLADHLIRRRRRGSTGVAELNAPDHALRGRRDILGSAAIAEEVQRIDQHTGIVPARSLHDRQGVVKAGNRAPAHVLQIDAHAEGGRKVAKRREIGDKALPIRVVAADTETSRTKRACCFQH